MALWLPTVLFTAMFLAGTARAQIGFKLPGGDNPLGEAESKAQEDLFTKAAAKLLDEQLPVNLDATHVLPTVSTLPGGTFTPRPLPLTEANMTQPLAPGDYSMNVYAFCTEYSVHQPGAGVAYELAPLEGKLSGAVATLLWRGIRAGIGPRDLMGAAWAIQSGLTYAQMPKPDQALIDRLIPDYKAQLDGDFLLQLESAYELAAKTAKLPTLPQLLVKMGKPGQLALDALTMQQALLRANTTDEIREQTLFAGQESGIYAPVKAEEGPWTVRIPGVAYVRYRIQGGNLAENNIIEIRILPGAQPQASVSTGARLLNASYSPDAADQTQAAAPTLLNLLGADETNGQLNASGLIGYSVGQGAQALIPVLPAPVSPPPPAQAQPKILYAGAEVTGQTGIKVAVGEQISVSMDANGLSVQTQQWDIPGTRIKGYTIAKASGQVTQLTEVSEPQVSFYWVDGSPARTVTLSYVLSDGTKGSVGATFNVESPTAASISTPTGTVAIVCTLQTVVAKLAPPCWTKLGDTTSLNFGGTPTNIGITYDPSLTPPPDFSGQTMLAQVIDSTTTAVKYSNGTSKTCSAMNALDSGIPFPSLDNPGVTLAPSAVPGVNTTDARVATSFTIFLMWRPQIQGATTIPVPMGHVDWRWYGQADFQNQSWVLAPTSSGSADPFVASTNFPQWNAYASPTGFSTSIGFTCQ
jgi:hypothetical protein